MPDRSSGTAKGGLPPRRRRGWVAFAIWAAFTAALFTLGARNIAQIETAAVAEAETRAEAGVETMQQYVRRTLDVITILDGLMVAEGSLRQTDPRGADLLLEQVANIARSELFGSLQVALVDATGTVSWSSVQGFSRISLSDRDHIRRILDGYRGTWVSPPLIGRVSNRWSLNFTRAVRGEGASLAGVVVVSLDPFLLARDLAEMQLRSTDRAIIVRVTDGQLLTAGVLRNEDVTAPPQPDHPLVQAARQQPSGVFEYRRFIDGRPALGAWRTVPGTPLVLGYAVDLQAELRSTIALVQTIRLVSFAASGFMAVGLALLLLWLTRREERHQAEGLMTAQREMDRLHTVLPAVIFQGDVAADGTYRRRYLSPSVTQVTGWPAEALAESEDWAAKCEPRDALIGGRVTRARMDEGQWTTECRMRRPDGSRIWLRIRFWVIRRFPDGGGEIVGYVVDITRERELAAQAAATAKLASLGEMATGLAHELNQPISVIILGAENVQLALEAAHGPDNPPPEGVLGRLKRIATQAARARKIINHFRIFGHPGDGAPEPVSLAEAVEGMRILTSGALGKARVGLELAIPADLPRVRAPLVQLEQVLVNLAMNARDAMAGHPSDRPHRLRLAAHAEGTMVVLAVSDTGGGIPPDILPNIFEPFVTSKPVGQGTGLGLSICQRIITSMGGTIAASNSPEGAVFTVTLPIWRDTDSAPQA